MLVAGLVMLLSKSGFDLDVEAFVNASAENIVRIFFTVLLVYLFVTLIPSLAAAVRRLHDTGRSGWNVLWAFTIVGVIPLLVWFCLDGKAGSNQWGPNPKGRQE